MKKIIVHSAILIAVIALYLLAAALSFTAHGETAVYYTVTITSELLNIRDKPGFDGEIIGFLYPGDTVLAIGYDGGWTKVKASIESGEGWVKSEYLSTSAEDTGSYVNTSGGRVRVRDGIGGTETGWIKAGKTVTVQSWGTDDAGNAWAYIGTGYVMGKYFTKAEDDE